VSLVVTAAAADPPAISDDIPTVDVAVFEVSTYRGDEIRGAYRFIQPMHKVRPPDWWTHDDRVAYRFEDPGDIGSLIVEQDATRASTTGGVPR
jgi:hypothetical protein